MARHASKSAAPKNKASGEKAKTGRGGGKPSGSKTKTGGGSGSSSASSSKSGGTKGKSTSGSSRRKTTSSSSSSKMSAESNAKLEKSFRNKVERTMQSEWYKVRRQGGTTYEEFVSGKVKELTRGYNNRRRTEDRIVDKYQERLRNKPNTTTKIKTPKGIYYVKNDDDGEIYQITSVDLEGKRETNNLPNKKLKLGRYKYETDEFGRKNNVSGSSEKMPEARKGKDSKPSIKTAVKKSEQTVAKRKQYSVRIVDGEAITECFFEEVEENTISSKEEQEKKTSAIEKKKKDYLKDLKEKSEFPETIDETKELQKEYKKTDSKEVQQKRKEFNDIRTENSKKNLRKQWEEKNNMPWPTYNEDVYDEKGRLRRRKGDKYDAHHIQPLELGGENDVSNITPLDIFKHEEIHADGKPLDALKKEIGEDK